MSAGEEEKTDMGGGKTGRTESEKKKEHKEKKPGGSAAQLCKILQWEGLNKSFLSLCQGREEGGGNRRGVGKRRRHERKGGGPKKRRGSPLPKGRSRPPPNFQETQGLASSPDCRRERANTTRREKAQTNRGRVRRRDPWAYKMKKECNGGQKKQGDSGPRR